MSTYRERLSPSLTLSLERDAALVWRVALDTTKHALVNRTVVDLVEGATPLACARLMIRKELQASIACVNTPAVESELRQALMRLLHPMPPIEPWNEPVAAASAVGCAPHYWERLDGTLGRTRRCLTCNVIQSKGMHY